MDRYYEYLQDCICTEQSIFETNFIYQYQLEEAFVLNEGVKDRLSAMREAFMKFVDRMIGIIKKGIAQLKEKFSGKKKDNGQPSPEEVILLIQKKMDKEVPVDDENIIIGGAGAFSSEEEKDDGPNYNVQRGPKLKSEPEKRGYTARRVKMKDAKIKIQVPIFKKETDGFQYLDKIIDVIKNTVYDHTDELNKIAQSNVQVKNKWEQFNDDMTKYVKSWCDKYANESGQKMDSTSVIKMLDVFETANIEKSKTERVISINEITKTLQRYLKMLDQSFKFTVRRGEESISRFEKYKKELNMKFKEIEIGSKNAQFKKNTFGVINVIANMYTTGINCTTKCINILKNMQIKFQLEIEKITNVVRAKAKV